MSNSEDIRQVKWRQYEEALSTLRDAVFVEEQGVPHAVTFDGSDATALHVLAELDGRPVGCGRINSEGKIGRMAVLPAYRNQGLGRRILDSLLTVAQEQSMNRVYLHAQVHATAFYTGAGFAPEGEEFSEGGLAHIKMTRDISYAGVDRFLTGVTYPRPYDQLAVELSRTAARHICILCPQLDHAAFDNKDLSEALSALARRGRQSMIRILVMDSRAIVQRGHRLMELARRLPSSVKLHKLAEHPEWKGQTVVTRDRDGVLYKPGDSNHECFYEPGSRASTQRHLDLFEDLWRHSAPDTEFRSLSL
ncbi:MAG: GNAT family N-acetyltransferase [Halieaceae bacterium]